MRCILLIGISILLLQSCRDRDTWSWESDTNGPPAWMADTNQCINISTWPADNRTGNPAYYAKKKKELQRVLNKYYEDKPE